MASRACATLPASSVGVTPGAGTTAMAATRPARSASRSASASLKNRASCRVRSPPAGRNTPLTVYVFGSPVACTVSRAPAFRPARAASVPSMATSSPLCGARPSVSAKGVRTAEVQACPYEGAPPDAAKPTGTAWKVSSGTTRRAPGTARTVSTAPAGSQARSATGLALCFVLVLPFFSVTVLRWTFWSAETTTGAAAYRSVAIRPRSPVSSSVPQAVISAAAHTRATKAPRKPAVRSRTVWRAYRSIMRGDYAAGPDP